MSVTRGQEGANRAGDGGPATGVGVLDRSIAILGAVEGGARTFTEIAGVTGLPRSTAHRLLRSLEAHGFLAGAGEGYRLGPRLLTMAASAARSLPLRELAHPHLVRLAQGTGESAQLYVRDGDVRICVDAVESARELRTIVEIGAALPLDRGSAGKVFLAWQSRPGSGPDGGLAEVRRRGWAESRGERETGVASVSAPVLGPDGLPLAAVSVSGPEARFRARVAVRRYADAVVETAREVETAIGSLPAV